MGNNNAYCQDSELSWLRWEDLPESAGEHRDFTKRLIALRQQQPILRRGSWRDGMHVEWLNAGGGEQTPEQWDDPGGTTIGLRLALAASPDNGIWNEVFFLFNPHDGEVPFRLPHDRSGKWIVELSTAKPEEPCLVKMQEVVMQPRSLLVLREVK